MTIEFIVQPRALFADLGEPVPKPTATTPGVFEAVSPLWNASGTEVGFWECSPGSFTARRDGYTEICQILSGLATIHTTDGRQTTIGAGDTLVMPDGWIGVWHVHEPLRKMYVTIDG